MLTFNQAQKLMLHYQITSSNNLGNWYHHYINCTTTRLKLKSRISVPSSRLSTPHQDLNVHPSRFKRWMTKRSRASTNKSFIFQMNIVPNCSLYSIAERELAYIISTKVWSRLQKCPPMQNFTI